MVFTSLVRFKKSGPIGIECTRPRAGSSSVVEMRSGIERKT